MRYSLHRDSDCLAPTHEGQQITVDDDNGTRPVVISASSLQKRDCLALTHVTSALPNHCFCTRPVIISATSLHSHYKNNLNNLHVYAEIAQLGER